jgi:hypothetical protein
MTVRDVLMKARALLAEPSHWTQGEYARTPAGIGMMPWSDRAVCWDLAGAVYFVAAQDQGRCDVMRAELEGYPATQLLRNLAGCESLQQWNDDPSRTHAEVLALLDRAIAEVERKENRDDDDRA